MKDEINKQIAKCLALLCVRNTCLEDIHAGIEPASPAGDFSDVKVVTPMMLRLNSATTAMPIGGRLYEDHAHLFALPLVWALWQRD